MFLNRYCCKYQELSKSPYFIDKSNLLINLNRSLKTKSKDFCFTSPPGFGKTQILNMCEAYYSKAFNLNSIFNNLDVNNSDLYLKNLNTHNVIYIDMFQDRNLKISIIDLIKQLCINYHIQNIYDYNCLSTLLTKIMNEFNEKFIILIDNYDYYFYLDSNSNKLDRNNFIGFMCNNVLNKEYVELSICFGIQDINNLSNDFDSYKIISYSQFNNNSCIYLGFNKIEVDKLHKNYLSLSNHKITRRDLDVWYGGYYGNISNCKCIVDSLNTNNLVSYQNNCFKLLLIMLKLNIEKYLLIELIDEIFSEKIKYYGLAKLNNNLSEIELKRNFLLTHLLNEGYLSIDSDSFIIIPNKECYDSLQKALKKLL